MKHLNQIICLFLAIISIGIASAAPAAPLQTPSPIVHQFDNQKAFMMDSIKAGKNRSLPLEKDTRLLMLWGTVGLLLYYLSAWYNYSRGSKKITVVPQYTPPANISPAGLRYILNMGYDPKVFAAAILTLAVNGYLKIVQTTRFLTSTFSLTQRITQTDNLSASEKGVLKELFAENDTVSIDRRLRATMENYKEALDAEFGRYFVTNKKFVYFGVFISLVLLVGAFLLNSHFNIKSINTFHLILAVVVPFTFTKFLSRAEIVIRGAFRTGGSKQVITAVGIVVISFIVIQALVSLLSRFLPSPYLLFSFLLAGINFIFAYLLKCETPAGAQIVAAAQGFKMFLAATEKDRRNFLGSPQETPELFEKYLPYALALDVEQLWSQHFAHQQEMAIYRPAWYGGSESFGLENFSSVVSAPLVRTLNFASKSTASRGG